MILVIGSQWLNKIFYDFEYHPERLFQPEYRSQGSINMVKLLSFRFQKYFGPFTMLLVSGFSET